jgi:hypothetical protein
MTETLRVGPRHIEKWPCARQYGAMPGGDDAERSDAEKRRVLICGDDAERSDAEERRLSIDGGSTW